VTDGPGLDSLGVAENSTMTLLFQTSLARTFAAVDEAWLLGRQIPRTEARAIAEWLAARQGLPGSYAGMFAPTSTDLRGIRLVTGERIATRAGIGHVLGEEACRVLRRLGVGERGAPAAALARAEAGMLAQLHAHAGLESGEYCCGICSIAMWRNLATGGLDHAEARLADGLRRLATHELADGTWRRYPFYYTLLALTEITGEAPLGALRHAAPRCERLLRRREAKSALDRRRRVVLERVLARVGG
jgi:hypothetical protein